MLKLQLYVVGHDPVALRRVCSPLLIPHAAVDLNDLGLHGDLANNQLAESRFFLSQLAQKPLADYVGVFTYRYDEKFHDRKTKLRDMQRLTALGPNRVYAPCISQVGWLDNSDEHHPGIRDLLVEVADTFELSYQRFDRRAPFCNNFLMSREMYLEFIEDWRMVFDYLHTKYGLALPVLNLLPHLKGREAGVVYERVSMLLLARYESEQIP